MLPKNTNEFSVTRAFVLVFLSKLPPLESISSVVLNELVYFIIDELLDIGCKGPAIGKPFITGSEECELLLCGNECIQKKKPSSKFLLTCRCSSHSILAGSLPVESVHHR